MYMLYRVAGMNSSVSDKQAISKACMPIRSSYRDFSLFFSLSDVNSCIHISSSKAALGRDLSLSYRDRFYGGGVPRGDILTWE